MIYGAWQLLYMVKYKLLTFLKRLRWNNRGDKILYTHKNQKAYSKNVSGSNMMISKNMRVYDGANSGQQKQIDHMPSRNERMHHTRTDEIMTYSKATTHAESDWHNI